MKIVHVIGGGDVGGAKTHVLSLVSKLSETNEVVLVCLRDGEFADDAKKLGINTLVIHSNPLSDILNLKKTIKQGGFDIVHSHGAKANVFLSLIKAFIKVPVITTVHSDYRLDYMGSLLKTLTNGLFNTAALRFLDGYIGVTSSFSDLLIERGFDPYKLFTLNNGINFNVPFSPALSREEYLSSLNLPTDENTVICSIAARFHPVKDIATPIKAFALLKDTCPNLYLLLGGDGEQEQELRELVSSLGISDRVIFTGWISDMDSFLNATDISIISSVSEGFPYSILESIQAHCTIVSTPVGALPEIIDDGENGLLFPVGDVTDLSKKLRMLYESPEMRKAMAAKLFEKASGKYSFDAMVSKQLSIYNEVLDAKATKKSKEHNILICGSYGRGNAGDDAILKAVTREVYDICDKAKICVMSKNPKQTRQRYHVRSFYTFNIFKMILEMRKSHLYINGGGSLIQDSTSSRSLWFYLLTLFCAHLCRTKVMMYGCGIGPVKRPFNRRLAKKVINKNVDCITLRDPDSLSELEAMGVNNPVMQLAADPTLRLAPADKKTIAAALYAEGIGEGDYICLAMRNWTNIDEKIAHFAAAADYAAERYGLKIVLLPMERKRDLPIAEKIKARLKSDAVIISGEYDVHTVIGILSKMRLIVAMRLHALVFGAGQGVSTIGIAYDHKVTGFMNYIGREMCTGYGECCFDILRTYIDRTMSDAEYEKSMHEACRRMRENEAENTSLLANFFEKEVNRNE